MEFRTFADNFDNLKYAILLKSTSLRDKELKDFYLKPLEKLGITSDQITFIGIPAQGKKFVAGPTKEHLANIASGLKNIGIKTILVANSDLYKYIRKVTKVAPFYGEIEQGKLEGFEDINVILSIDWYATYYNDSLVFKLDNSLKTLALHNNGPFNFTKDIIHNGLYINQTHRLSEELAKLHNYDEIWVDVETTGLRYETCDLLTIGFSTDKHNGFAFEFTPHFNQTNFQTLKSFFQNYTGVMNFWNVLYDVKVLIFQLFMDDLQDWHGMYEGLLAFENVEDIQLVAYLCLNSTQENPLDLKINTFEFTGNYAEDVTDATLVDIDDLLVYNLKDCLATAYAKEKYWQQMIDDNQYEVYQNIIRASIPVLLVMMFVGMPMDEIEINVRSKELSDLMHRTVARLRQHPKVQRAVMNLRRKKVIEDNKELKTKIRVLSEIKMEFNPGSPNHVRELLYQVYRKPVMFTTTTGLPSTDKVAIQAMQQTYSDDEDFIRVLEDLRTYSNISIILSTFVSAFINYGIPYGDRLWIHGNLRLGGTQSGRLSSNSPNLQNMPSGSTYGKTVKKMFRAPSGFLFAGADFSSLEDRINALLTKDPNKIKVYTDGYDGHCLRTHAYFGDEMPDIDGSTVEGINSIEEKYPKLRQKSKAPTFALTYLGTWKTLVINSGFEADEAHKIEDNYHTLYEISDEWANEQIDFAYEHGYVECAFGLRLRTPLLRKSVRRKKNQAPAIEAEERSAVNAVTQSWGMLINRTAIAIMNDLLYRPDDDTPEVGAILPMNTIHDAIYFLVRDDPQSIKWLNDHLIAEMEWNEHPAIKSDEVPMAADMTIGLTWADQFSLPNNASIEEIEEIRSKIHAS